MTPAVSTAAFDGHPLEVALDELTLLGVAAVEPAYIKGYVDFDETGPYVAETGASECAT